MSHIVELLDSPRTGGTRSKKTLYTGTMRTIGIDCRFAGTRSGIGRYTKELVRCLLKRNDPWRYIFFVRDKNDFGDLPLSDTFQVSTFDVPFYSLEEQWRFPSLIRQSKIDLLHVPHFNAPLFCPSPFIVTIHDLILHQYPNQASLAKRIAYRTLMKHAMKKSAHIFAVSAFTAGEIERTYGEYMRKKMTVTHEGVSDQFRPASEEEKNRIRKVYDLPSMFILYTGACKEHKNIQTLIDAVPENLSLILITGGKELKRLKMKPNVRILANVPDADLPILMSTANVSVQPSLYEGFGLPVLEAMACGTTVVASNRSSIPEMSGGNAILVEPTAEGLRAGIGKGLQYPHDHDRLRAHAKKFSWETMAEKTAAIYGKCISIPPTTPTSYDHLL